MPDPALSSETAGPFHALRAWLRRRREDARLRGELRHVVDCLDHDRELDEVLAGLGISREGLPALIRRYPGAVRRHEAMRHWLDKAGIAKGAESINHSTLFGAGRRCVFCVAAERCGNWVEHPERDQPAAFCPRVKAQTATRQS